MKKDILKVGLDPILQFEAIARAQSLKKASNELGLSQPAVTQALNKLEENLKVQLCVRSRSTFELTEAGKRLFQVSKEIKAELKKYEAFLTDDREFDGHLSIGIIDNFQNGTLEETVKKTIAEFPGMKLSIQVHAATEIQNLIMSGEIDIGFGIFNRKLEQLTYRNIGFETINFYISENHFLWNYKDVKIGQLKDQVQTWVDIISRNRSSLDNEIFTPSNKKGMKVSSYVNNLNAAVLILRSGTSVIPIPAEYMQSRKFDFKYQTLDAVFPPYKLNQELAMHKNFLNASPAAKFFANQFSKK